MADIIGDSRNNQINGGLGDDILRGGAGNDTLSGGDGADVLDGEFGNDVLLGGLGNDVLSDNLGANDSLFGNEGDDVLRVRDLAEDGSGARTLVLDGGSGNDSLRLDFHYNTASSVTLNGGDGNDVIAADGGGLVQIDGGAGSDTIKVNAVAGYEDLDNPLPAQARTTYRITLGSGSDTLSLLSSNDTAWRAGLDGGNDTAFDGTAFNTIVVTDFAAGAGGDRIDLLGLLRDQIVGIGASDWDPATNPFATGHLRLAVSGADVLVQLRLIEYDFNSTTPIIVYKTLVRLQNVTAASLTAANLSGFDPSVQGGLAFLGTSANDSLTGGAGNDQLYGEDGDDVLFGGAGNDTLRGGQGSDRLFGGTGNDFLSEAAGDTGPFGNDYYDGGEGNDRVSLFTNSGPRGDGRPAHCDSAKHWIDGDRHLRRNRAYHLH